MYYGRVENMGHMTTYMLLMFGISFSLYLGGYPPAFLAMQANVGDSAVMLSTIINHIMNNIVIVGVASAAVVALVASGSSLARSVAMLIVFGGLINIFLVPSTMWESAAIPNEVKLGITLFFNIITFLVVMELMTERDI